MREITQLRCILCVALSVTRWHEEIEAQGGNTRTVAKLSEHGLWAISADAGFRIQLLDLGVSEFHQDTVGAGSGISKQGCPLANPKSKARNASGADVGGIGAFRAQKFRVHEQAVEEDFDATRGHGPAKNNLPSACRQQNQVPRRRGFHIERAIQNSKADCCIPEPDRWLGIRQN